MVSFMLYRSDTLATPTATIRTRYVLSVQERGGQIYEEKKRDHDIFYYHISGTPNPKPDEAATHGYGKKKKKKRNEKNEENFVPIFFFFLNFVYRTPVDQAQVQQKLSGTRRKLPLLIPFWFLFSISDLKKREENKMKKTKCFLFSFPSSQRDRSGGTQRQQTGRSVCGKPRRRHRVCGRHHHAPSHPG